MADQSLEGSGVARARGSLVDLTLLAGRILTAYLFVSEGVGKIAYYAPVQDYMTQHAVSPRWLPPVILLELGAGLLVALGLFTRTAAVSLAAFCVLTAALFHNGGDPASEIEFKKNLALCGGLLALAARGAGAFSLDAFPFWRGRIFPSTRL